MYKNDENIGKELYSLLAGFLNMFFCKIKKIIIAITTILCVTLILFIVAIPVVNDNVAKKTAEDILSVPLPEKTDYIESKYLAGKLVGNGNGMQYFGAILIKSRLTLDELQRYYSGYTDNEWTYVVGHQQNSKIDIIEHGYLEFESKIDGGGFYIVYSWGDNNSIFAGFDIRGH